MRKSLLFLFLSFMLAASAAAQHLVITGQALENKTKQPVEFASVALLRPDSTAVLAGTTDEKGCFALQAKETGKYLVRLSFVGFTPAVKPAELTAETDTLDLGTILLSSSDNVLGAATVTAVASRVEQKDDTTMFNAAAYRVPEGSTLEALVKQLPGVEVGDDGTIKWNGKKVTTLAPKAVAAGKTAPSVSRSLWADDDEDWFKFDRWESELWREVTEARQIKPVFIPYHRVTLQDLDGSVLAELKVLDGEAASVPDDLPVAPTLSDGSVFSGWSQDLSCVREAMTATPVYYPKDSVLWSHVVWNEGEYYDNSTKAFHPEHSAGNLLLTPDAGVSLKCYWLAEPDKELAAGYTIITNNLLHTTGTYNCEIPNQTMLEIVLPHDAEHLQRQVQSIVIWTSAQNPATGYVENEITIDAVEYRRKADSAWKPVSEIESLNGYATKAVEGASAAYGFRIVMERRDGSPLIPMAAAVRLRLGTTGTGTATRIGEIQVFGGAVAQSGVCVMIR